jgi:hypothetical protein
VPAHTDRLPFNPYSNTVREMCWSDVPSPGDYYYENQGTDYRLDIWGWDGLVAVTYTTGLWLPPIEYDPSGAHLVSMDPGGTVSWEKVLGDPLSDEPSPLLLTDDDRVVLGSSSGLLWAFDAVTGSALTPVDLGGPVEMAPALGLDNTVYTLTRNGNLVAAVPGNAVSWSKHIGGRFETAPAATSDGFVVVACPDGTLRLFDPTGVEKWSLHLSGPSRLPLTAGPTLADGKILVGRSDGTVFAFGAGTGGTPPVAGNMLRAIRAGQSPELHWGTGALVSGTHYHMKRRMGSPLAVPVQILPENPADFDFYDKTSFTDRNPTGDLLFYHLQRADNCTEQESPP